jgi:hypothetical protein
MLRRLRRVYVGCVCAFLVLSGCCTVSGSDTNSTDAPAERQLPTADLASLSDEEPVGVFLKHLGLQQHIDALALAGFDEVRYVKRMKSIDFSNLVSFSKTHSTKARHDHNRAMG